jgi:FAR-17a/AIG1-like protein
MRRPTLLVILLGLLPLLAIGRQLIIHVQLGLNLTHFFSFYTNLSNLLAGWVLLWSAFVAADGPRGDALAILRLMAVINMTIVGVVFAVLLRNLPLGALLPWVNIVLHYIMPCVMLLDWVLWPPRRPLPITALAACLPFPLLYLGYTLARGHAFGWYPYPFLNPAKAGGYAGVTAYAVGITALFLIVGFALMAIANKRLRGLGERGVQIRGRE